MEVPARLKWKKLNGCFVAWPTATEHDQRFVSVRLTSSGLDTDSFVHSIRECWTWQANWRGWFCEVGHASSKQEAADSATEAWWRLVRTDIPRDPSFEAAMIAARALVMPPPNSLFAEDDEYIRTVIWHLHRVWGDEIKAGVPAVKNLYDQLSAEMYRRRMSGEIPDPPIVGPVLQGQYRRRRRR